MKNLLGGLIGVLIGSFVLVLLVGLTSPAYNWPYSTIWIILSGSNALKSTIDGISNPNTLLGYILTWIIIGVVISPFSKKGWNTVRSAVWVGIILGILSLVSILLLDANYWTSPTRNIDLVYHFVTALSVSLFVIPSAFPSTLVIDRIKKQAEMPIPEKIETSCECGAVFKSNPLICSECGKQLRDD
ncbi:MAG: hypothetical protein KAJ36_06645 [Candidatus Thorarchaeota archaeon]|nr:hypothetical protein [Candidatus Thorarchaeota archaeon]